MNYARGNERSPDSFAKRGLDWLLMSSSQECQRRLRWTYSSTLMTLCLGVAASWGIAGCSTGAAKPASLTPTISVAMTQVPPTSLIVGATATVSATVTSDVANAGVDWVATCGSAPNCGSFSPSHTASGATTTYTAPLGVPAHNTVSIAALSTTDHSKAFATTVTITSTVTAITIIQPPAATMPAGAILNLGASVDGDPANLGVDWTATCSTTIGPVTCSSSGLHSTPGGTAAFVVPQSISVPGTNQIQSLIGTSISITAFATADHSFTATASFTVTDPISINITQAPPVTMLTGATAPVIAVVTNDTTNSGVTWSVSCPNDPCGTVTPVQTASGIAATFTAPPTVPSPNPPPGLQVTITAFATATGLPGTSSTVVRSSVIVNIVAPISVKITTPIANNTLTQNSSASIAAVVSNDSANAGVDWTVTCGSAGACGSFSASHTASGGPTTFTAPAAVPAGGIITITATSTTDPTKTDQELVSVTNAVPPNSLLTGTFVLFLSAKNSKNGPFILGGVISGDGTGKITGGSLDLTDFSGNASPAQLVNVVAPSTYSIGLDGRGQIQLTINTFALNNSFGVPGPNRTGTIALSVVFVTPQHALLSETDSFGGATGTLDLQKATDVASFQNGSAGLNGTYSLLLSGVEATSATADYFLAGAITTQASGNSYTLAGYTVDQSAKGAIASVPFAAASQAQFNSAPTQFGEISLNSVNLGLPTHFNLDLWLIDANHFVVTDWQDSISGSLPVIVGGYLTPQPASPSLSGTYAFTNFGVTTAAQPQASGGILACGSTGILDVVPLGGTALSNQPVTVTCGAPATGRGLIAISGASTAGINQFAAYPTLDRGLYLVELDGGAAGTSGPAGAGVALPQTLSAPISSSALNGAYALNVNSSTAAGSQTLSGQMVSDSVSALTGVVDVNSFNTTTIPEAATPSLTATLSGTYIVGSNGRFPLALTISPTSGQPSPQITNLNPACYVVDANTCLLLGLDTTAPGIGILQLQNTGL